MEFPYVRRRDQSYPIIPVTLRNNDREIRTEALVDSGASVSTFQGDLAEALGLPLASDQPIYLQGVGGRALGYVHNVLIQVGENQFECPIVFSPELTSSVNLLGRTGFFEQFQVTFDERIHKLHLTPYA